MCKMIKIEVSLPVSELEDLEAIAKERGIAASEELRRAIIQEIYLKRNKNAKIIIQEDGKEKEISF